MAFPLFSESEVDGVQFMPAPLISNIIRQISWIRNIRGGLRGMLYLAPVSRNGDDFVIDNAGLNFYCDLSSYVEWHMYHFKQYEGRKIALFMSLFSPDSCLFDIGANIGNHTLNFSRHVQSVHGFEPNPEIFERLQRNLALNGTTNIVANRVGLAQQNGQMNFYAPIASEGQYGANMGSGTFIYDEAPHPHKVLNLPIFVGDDYVDAHKLLRVDGMKIDVQGFEIDVLSGLSRTLERHEPIIWMECSTSTLNAISELPQGLRQIVPYAYKLKYFQTSYTLGLFHKTELVEVGDFRDPPFTGDFVILPQ
jgi:FkbM family methyltransferase